MKIRKSLSAKQLAAVLFCLLLLCVFLPLAPVFTPAEEAGKVVRVGWYESAFHQTDSYGRRSGYGYEYQQRVGTYTGWTYEYVEGSWSELFEKLVNGEIDLLSDVSYTEERAQNILYSSESMGAEDYHAFIAPDNTEIRPDDFSTFNGKRVGVNKNSIQEQMFIEWAESHNVYPEIVELTGKSPELIEMLFSGEIDVLITLDIYGSTSDMVPVCKTGSSNIYFGINKNRPDLKNDLDVAMNRILEENRYYNQQLAEKYEDGQGINDFLSVDEKNWLTEHGPIRVGYQTGYLPFSDLGQESETLTGALSDYLEIAKTTEKNAELDFVTVPFNSEEQGFKALAEDRIDALFPVYLSVFDGEQRGVSITDPFVVTTMHAAVRSSDRRGLSQDEEMNVAVPRENLNYRTFLMDKFPNWNLIPVTDVKEGAEQVAAGGADCILVSNYRIPVLDDLCKQYKLSTLSTGQDLKLSFAVRLEDDCLFSILNKVNHQIPDTVVNSALTSYSFTAERVTFADFLRDNLVYVLIAAAIIVIIILLLILHTVRAQRKASEGRSLIRKTERDRLTNLYNRDFFFVYANQMFRETPEKPRDAVVLNIERFHTVNTLNGREFGDAVLRALGNEAGLFALENEGIAGRFEGDRFDIYCAHRKNYNNVLGRFQTKMNTLFPNADIRLRMGVMPWQDGMEPEVMFDLARAACSTIRGKYNMPLMVYDEEMRRHEIFNERLKKDLSLAISEKQINVYYQPKFDIRSDTATLFSAEALIRWRHPELGVIMPGDFVPLLEQSGQVTELDHYVWAEAARQMASWKKQYGFWLPVSVNLSRVDIFDPDLMKVLDDIVIRYGVPRSSLKLEITESAYTENSDQLIQVIRELRMKGFEIEMDDFGSGYSSLNMLSSMPVDVLKMDREFIRNIEKEEKDVRLVELILNIGKNLKIPVIAEGVETEGQLRLLKQLGCPLVQGFYFSRPVPAAEFEKQFIQKVKA